MRDNHDQLIDLGDAVAETKGALPVGIADQLGNYKQTGLSDED